MSETLDHDEDEAGPVVTKPAAPKPVTPAPTPASAAPIAQAKPAVSEPQPVPQVPAQPVAAPAAVTPPVPVQPAAPAATPAVETPEVKAAREKAEKDTAEKASKERFDGLMKQYTLPEDLAVRLQTEPEQVLPFLAAKVHEHVMQQVENAIRQQVPGMIHQVTESHRRNEEAKSSFYKAWPSLNEKEHGDKVLLIGSMFRQLNPTATHEQAIERIGQVVHAALGIPLPGPRGNGEGAPRPTAPRPQAPATPAFRPAGGGGGALGAPAPDENEWSRMAEALLTDEAGT